MLTPSLITAFIFCFIGGILNEESAPSLLSGYNTMSDEKKQKVNFKGIIFNFKRVFYTIAVLLVAIGVLSYFIENDNLWASLLSLTITWGLIPLFFLGKKYNTNTYSKWQYAINYFVILFLFSLGFFIVYTIYNPEGSLKIN